jgi:putative membrane protein
MALVAATAMAIAASLPGRAAMMTSAQDAAFVTAAAQGGMAEVQDAEVARTRGDSAAVKAFAAKMIADHTKANARLSTIARKDGYTLPTTVGTQNATQKSTLRQLSGKTFDTTYLDGQMQDHEVMAQLFKKEIASGKNPDLVAFAKATLPTVEEHLTMAKSDVGPSATGMSTPAANQTAPAPMATST